MQVLLTAILAVRRMPRLKVEKLFKRRKIPHAQLVGKLADIGVMDSEPNIRNKLSPGQIYSGVSDSMSGSDRSLLAPAIFGLIVIGWGAGLMTASNADQQRYHSYRYAPDDEAAATAALSNKAKPPEYHQPCHDPHGKEESDLCAQWRAAYAAENSAYWAKWSFWVGALGIAGLIATIIQGRLGLDRAMDANSIARDIGEAQTRAYVSIENAWLSFENARFSFRLQVVNSGQSPASDFGWTVSFHIGIHRNGATGPAEVSRRTPRISPDTIAGKPIAAQRSHNTGYIYFPGTLERPGWLSPEEMKLLASGNYTAIVTATIEWAWTDVFEKRHKPPLAQFDGGRITSPSPIEIEMGRII